MVKRLLLVIPLILGFGLANAIAQDEDIAVDTADDPELGLHLTDSEGMVLYLFTNDEEGMSNCYDECAENWPPFMADDPLMGSDDVTGELTQVERDDGTMQVAYEGWPLYYFAGDEAPGDANGQGLNDVWFVVNPDDPEAMIMMPDMEMDATPEATPDMMATPEDMDMMDPDATPDDMDEMDPDATPPS